MAMNRVQFQPGLSLSAFLRDYGTEDACFSALIKARWPSGFICPHAVPADRAFPDCDDCDDDYAELDILKIISKTRIRIPVQISRYYRLYHYPVRR